MASGRPICRDGRGAVAKDGITNTGEPDGSGRAVGLRSLQSLDPQVFHVVENHRVAQVRLSRVQFHVAERESLGMAAEESVRR